MIYLLLSILSSVTIVISFKLIDRWRVDTFRAIVLNYLVAFLLGLFLSGDNLSFNAMRGANWIIMAIIIGILFVIMFCVLGFSVQKTGMGISTIAAKISVVIPIGFSLIAYSEPVGSRKLFGICLALVSLVLIVFRKEKTDKRFVLLPVVLFIGMGTVDSLIKFAQETFLRHGNIISFSTFLFFISFLTSLFIHLAGKNRSLFSINGKLLFSGVLLGMANLGSLFFFVKTLNSRILDSSLIFVMNNIGILILSVITGVFVFREHFSLMNWTGFLLALFSIYVIFGA